MTSRRTSTRFPGVNFAKSIKANPVYIEEKIDFDFSKALFKFTSKKDDNGQNKKVVEVR